MNGEAYKYLIYSILTTIFLTACDDHTRLLIQPPQQSADTTITYEVYTLAQGGEIAIPTGAIPAGTEISIIETIPPALPDELVAVGTGYFVDVDADLRLPATIRLPIPAGENADELAIIRIEEYGAISILQSTVEEGLLMARTPGFSWVTPARLSQRLRDTEPIIKGPDYLPLSTTTEIRRAQYFESVFADAPDLIRDWRAFSYAIADEMFTLETSDDAMKNNVAMLYSLEEGRIDLQLTMREPTTGAMRSVLKTIEVRSPDDIDVSAELDINIIAPLIVEKNESFVIGANILNLGSDTVSSWSWTLAGSESSCHEGCSPLLVTPAFSFPEEGRVTFTVSATAGDRLGEASLNIEVMGELAILAFETVPEDAQIRTWTSSRPSVSATATARIIYGRDPYTYHWALRPEGVMAPMDNVHHADTDSIEISFDQPGEYPLSLHVNDAEDNVAPRFRHGSLERTLTRWFYVGPPENVQVALLDVPGEWAVNRQLEISLQARGGQLVKEGRRNPYYVIVDWGDGSDNAELLRIEADSPNDWNRLDNLRHTYRDTKSYTISVEAFPGWFLSRIRTDLLLAEDVFFPGGTKAQASAQVDIVADTSFGFPEESICPASVEAQSCPPDWCDTPEPWFSTFIFSEFRDYGAILVFEATCYYVVSNPPPGAPDYGYDEAYLDLDYDSNPPNDRGCGSNTQERWVVGENGDVYSTERMLVARAGPHVKEPATAVLGELIVKAAAAGVGAACPQ